MIILYGAVFHCCSSWHWTGGLVQVSLQNVFLFLLVRLMSFTMVYCRDDDPDNPENYHMPDVEENVFGDLARDQVTHSGLKHTAALEMVAPFSCQLA
jgi:hypothetical protein